MNTTQKYSELISNNPQHELVALARKGIEKLELQAAAGGEVQGPVATLHADLKRRYHWNGSAAIQRLSENSSLVRIRTESGAEFHATDMAVVNLQFWGAFVWAENEARISSGPLIYPPAEKAASAATQ